jgi:hypothetical protein
VRLLLVSVLVVLALGSGCYRSHQRRPSDAGVRDGRADVPSVDAPGLDVPDAPVPLPECVHRPFGETQLTDFPSHSARSPDLVRTSSGLSAVFLESDGDIGHPIVSLVHTDERLGGATMPVLVGEESHSWAEAVVLEDETLGIGWIADPGLVTRTAFRRIDAFGRPFGDRVDVDFEGSSCLDLARSGGTVAVVYRGMEGGEGVAYLAFIEPIGGGLRGDRYLLGSDEVSPQVVPFGGPEVLVVTVVDSSLRLAPYSALGPRGVSTVVVTLEGPIGRTTVARADDGSTAFAVQFGESGMRGLYVLVLDRDLRSVLEPYELVPEGFGVIGSRIVATPAGFVVSWGETLGDFGEGRFMVAHLGPDGLPSEARRVVFEGQLGSFAGPGLAATAERTWLATSRPPGGAGHAELFLAGYECIEHDPCESMDARAIDMGCSETRVLGWRWTGVRCEALEGCGVCDGPDCDALASGQAECEIDHLTCTE